MSLIIRDKKLKDNSYPFTQCHPEEYFDFAQCKLRPEESQTLRGACPEREISIKEKVMAPGYNRVGAIIEAQKPLGERL
jgi:hypothetical protein